MKDFYIVPNLTNPSSYYDKVAAETREDAIIGFADSMDLDMSAYFNAVETIPSGIHSYDYPEGDFAVAMSIIADTMNGNEKSSYYSKDALDGLTINVMELASLQKNFDMLKSSLSKVPMSDVKDCFFKILCAMTGFAFDEDSDDEDCKVRIQVIGDDLWCAENALDAAGIEWEWDDGGRLIVSSMDAEQAVAILEEGYKVNII